MRVKFILLLILAFSICPGLEIAYALTSDTPPDARLTTIKGHSNFVRSVAFSPDGKFLASGSGDGTIKIWQVDGWEEVATLRGHNGNVFSVSFSPDGKYLASGSNDSNIKIWQTEDWKELTTIVGNSGPIYSVVFSPDGKYLTSGSYKVIKIWNVADWKELKTLEGHVDRVNTVAFSSDMKYLASGSADFTAKVWLVRDWSEQKTLEGHRGWVNSVTFSPDVKYLVTGSGDSTTKIWQVGDWKEVTTLKGHKNIIFSTTFTPDGKYLVTGSGDSVVRLWRVEDWYNLTTSMNHKNQVLSVAMSPDGKYLASGCWDTTISLWVMETALTDWSTGHPELPPYLVAKLELLGEAKDVKAGSTVQVRITVENKGRGEAYRLSGRIDSRLNFFSDHEFLFGKVGVGETIAKEIPVTIPKAHFALNTTLKMKWEEANDYIPNPTKFKLHIEALPRPEFTYNYVVIDDFSGNSMGSGDGRIHKGETIELSVGVLNIGQGEAEKVNVEITSLVEEGVRMHIPRNVITNLGPGEYKKVRVSATVLRTGALPRLPLAITINDPVLGVRLDDKLYLPIEAGTAPQITEVKQIMTVKAQQMRVFGATTDDALELAQISRGNNVMVTGLLGGWSRIMLSEDETGWARMADMTKSTASVDTPPKPQITELFRKTPPLINISYPNDNSTTSKEEITLLGKVKDEQSIVQVGIYINGVKFKTLPETKQQDKQDKQDKEQQQDLQDKQPLLPTISLKETIPLKIGKNIITISCYDNDKKTRTKTITVTRTAEKEDIWAVLIGIGEYDSEDIKPLRLAKNNIQSMKDYLINDFGVPKQNVSVLMNQNATLTKIKKELGVELARKAGKEDKVIIYFCGRGVPEEDPASADEDGYEKYLLPHDADPDFLYATALHMDEMSKIFRRIKAERLIFLAETSFSRTSDGTSIRDLDISPKFWEQVISGKGRVMLSSSKPSELSQELDDLEHGVFTYYLLEGMRGKADLDGDKTIDIDEVYRYVTKKVRKTTGKQQNPVKIGEGQIVLGRVK